MQSWDFETGHKGDWFITKLLALQGHMNYQPQSELYNHQMYQQTTTQIDPDIVLDDSE